MNDIVKKLVNSNQNIVLIIISYFAIVFITSVLHFRIDLTSGGLYTLSKGSKKIISSLDEDITIKYFFSKSNKTLPIQVKSYGNKVNEILEEFAAESKHLKLEVYDPKPDSDEEELATRYGINGAQVNDGEIFYMGAALLYLDEVYQIPFFDPQREQFLEYEIASLFAKIGEKTRKTIGILAGFPIQDQTMPYINPGMQNPNEDQWLFRNELKDLYDIAILEKEIEEIPAHIDILLVAHPIGFNEKTEYAIEQFILSGGKAMLIVDPSPYTITESAGSDLPKVFQTLQLNYKTSEVAVDEENSTMVNTPRGRLRLPVWLTFDKSGFSKSAVATNQLQNGIFVESGYFSLKSDSSYSFTPLIETSKSGGSISSAMAKSLINRPDSYEKKNHALTLAGIVKGKFKSSFEKKPKDSKFINDHLSEAKEEVSALVIGDIDFLNNKFSLKAFNFFGRTVIKPQNHNIAFLVNSVEFIAGKPELISVRSRGTFSRPFDTVKNLEQKAQEKWLGVEQELSQKIQKLQSKLNEMQKAKTDDNQVILSQAQKDEIRKFKLEQIEAKKKRREVRKQLRLEIESLGSILSGINIGFIPILVLCSGLFIYSRRNKGIPLFKKGA